MHFIQCHTSFYTMLVRKGMRLHWLWRSVRVWSTGHASGEPVQGRGHGQPPHCNNKVPPRELAHSAPPQHPELGEETLPREYTALLD